MKVPIQNFLMLRDFEVEVQARFEAGQFFFCSSFVEVMKLNLGQDSKARFGQDFEAYVLWRG